MSCIMGLVYYNVYVLKIAHLSIRKKGKNRGCNDLLIATYLCGVINKGACF